MHLCLSTGSNRECACARVHACMYARVLRVSCLGDISLYEYMFVYVYTRQLFTARLDTIGVVFSLYIRVTRTRIYMHKHARTYIARARGDTRVYIKIYANGIYKIILYSCYYIYITCCCC